MESQTANIVLKVEITQPKLESLLENLTENSQELASLLIEDNAIILLERTLTLDKLASALQKLANEDQNAFISFLQDNCSKPTKVKILQTAIYLC